MSQSPGLAFSTTIYQLGGGVSAACGFPKQSSRAERPRFADKVFDLEAVKAVITRGVEKNLWK